MFSIEEKNKLDSLIKRGIISSYYKNNVDEEGNFGSSSEYNAEQLVLKFKNGETLVIDSFCSGEQKDTHIYVR